MLKWETDQIRALGEAVRDIPERIGRCPDCGGVAAAGARPCATERLSPLQYSRFSAEQPTEITFSALSSCPSSVMTSEIRRVASECRQPGQYPDGESAIIAER